MAFALPSHEYGEIARDAGIRLPVHLTGEIARDAGVALPGYNLGEIERDAGVRLARHQVGETLVAETTTPGQLPVIVLGQISLDAGVRLPLLLFLQTPTTIELPVVQLGQIAIDAGVRLPPAALGAFTLDAGVRLPRYEFGELAVFTGSFAESLPAITGALTGRQGYGGSILASLPALTATGSGFLALVGQFSARLPAITATNQGAQTYVGTLTARLPAHTLTAVGALHVVASIAATLPRLLARLTSGTIDTAELVVVVNLMTDAVTEYELFDFNSFAEHGGRLYGANGSGIYLLEGDDDAGADIAAHFTTARTDHGDPRAKRVTDAYIAGESDAAIKLTVTIDGDSYDFLLRADQYDTFDVIKTNLGKGAKGRFWQYTVANTLGAGMSVHDLGVELAVLPRKVG
ncbi:MAG: hypothetical protein AB7Q97_01670 [Gammaproteobacteria bacterium]